MKNILILFLFFTSASYSQVIYPLLKSDSTGQKIVIMTMEQAQKLDNATEYSPILFKEKQDYAKLIDSLCIQTIELKSLEVIAIQEEKRQINDSLSYMINKYNQERESNLYVQSQYERIIAGYKENDEVKKTQIEKEKKKSSNLLKALGVTLIALVFSVL